MLCEHCSFVRLIHVPPKESEIQQVFAVYSKDEFLGGEPVLDDECASDKPGRPARKLRRWDPTAHLWAAPSRAP